MWVYMEVSPSRGITENEGVECQREGTGVGVGIGVRVE